jgi:hypothetical protein
MNAWRIVIFVFSIQMGIFVITQANIPLACQSDGTSCIFFTADTISATDMGAIINNEVDSSQYKATQIEEDIFNTDFFTATSTALKTLTNFAYLSVFGIFAIVTFIFGSNGVGLLLATILQSIVYFFYGVLIVDKIKPGGGNI